MIAAAQEAPGSAGAAAFPTIRVGLTRLGLTEFRNYAQARLSLGTEMVVLTGPNGAGKTNLLEAVSLLAPGRGLRGAQLAEIDRRAGSTGVSTAHPTAPGGWAVAAAIATRRGRLSIGTGREDGGGGGRRVVRIDGEAVSSQAELGERLAIVWLTPAMDRLFVEGPGNRRRFLDRLVLTLDPAHAARIGRYENALRQRSRLLRDGLADLSWLTAIEQTMATQGVAVAASRREAVAALARSCAEATGPFPRARLALVGTVEEWLETMPALAAETKFATALAANRRIDAATGTTALGPHRSDLELALADGGTAAALASTGEQKALLISILLAHAALLRASRGEAPLLLLDEVAAHLDAGRRAALFETLARSDGQAWLTGTDAALFAPLRDKAQFVSVHDGRLLPTCS